MFRLCGWKKDLSKFWDGVELERHHRLGIDAEFESTEYVRTRNAFKSWKVPSHINPEWEKESDIYVYQYRNFPVYGIILRHHLFGQLNGYIHFADEDDYKLIERHLETNSPDLPPIHGGWNHSDRFEMSYFPDILKASPSLKAMKHPHTGGIMGFDTGHSSDLAPAIRAVMSELMPDSTVDRYQSYKNRRYVYDQLLNACKELEYRGFIKPPVVVNKVQEELNKLQVKIGEETSII